MQLVWIDWRETGREARGFQGNPRRPFSLLWQCCFRSGLSCSPIPPIHFPKLSLGLYSAEDLLYVSSDIHLHFISFVIYLESYSDIGKYLCLFQTLNLEMKLATGNRNYTSTTFTVLPTVSNTLFYKSKHKTRLYRGMLIESISGAANSQQPAFSRLWLHSSKYCREVTE